MKPVEAILDEFVDLLHAEGPESKAVASFEAKYSNNKKLLQLLKTARALKIMLSL